MPHAAEKAAQQLTDTRGSLQRRGSCLTSNHRSACRGSIFCFEPLEQARDRHTETSVPPCHSLKRRPSRSHGKPRAPRGLRRTLWQLFHRPRHLGCRVFPRGGSHHRRALRNPCSLLLLPPCSARRDRGGQGRVPAAWLSSIPRDTPPTSP